MALESLTTHAESVFTLPELVDVANNLLPSLLPKDAGGRVAEDVNPRLVRHYTTLGLLPEPRKEGREARYLYEHLLRLLVVRKLLANGYSSQAIAQLLPGLDEDTLVKVLDGGVELRLVPAGSPTGTPANTAEPDERWTFLERVRSKAGLAPAAPPATPAPAPGAPAAEAQSSPAPLAVRSVRREAPSRSAKHKSEHGVPTSDAIKKAFNETSWTSYTMADGLELFVRSDFSLPATRLGDEQLLDLMKMLLLNLEQRQRSRP